MKKRKTTKTTIVYDSNDKIIEKKVEIVEIEESEIGTGGYVKNHWSSYPPTTYFGDSPPNIDKIWCGTATSTNIGSCNVHDKLKTLESNKTIVNEKTLPIEDL